MVVLEHVGEDRVDSTLALKIRPIWQKTKPPLVPPAIMMDALSLDLLNTYFLEEFRVAGLVAEGEEERWLETVIDTFFVARVPGSLPRYQLIFTVTLNDVSEEGRFWSEKMEYVWTPLAGALAVNDEVGDAITFQLLTRVARGLTVLLDLPPVGPADTPASTESRPAAVR